ncbi:uncharacterized protein [Spinacia oleracea]|uniref:Retrotransposon gag domain-containing protein n=1 Tax=Spinacia oleracea TaxID=3562 RepID=A0A9R0KCP7_SPIOL|nr:uncharacterized protein LOC110805710 [Spinacia oleracea]
MAPTSSPFIEELVMEEIPKVRLPAHLTYNGTTDPRDHVISYEQQMFLIPQSKACWCKYFPTTLTGVAGEWFRSLPKGSVDNFKDLSEKLCVQFVSNNRFEQTTAELASIQQERGEILRDFMARLMKESTNIPNLQPDVAIFSLKHALQEGRFCDKLSMKNPTKLAAVLQMADAFFRTKDFNKAAAKLKGSSEPKDTKANRASLMAAQEKEKRSKVRETEARRKKGKRVNFNPSTPTTLHSLFPENRFTASTSMMRNGKARQTQIQPPSQKQKQVVRVPR